MNGEFDVNHKNNNKNKQFSDNKSTNIQNQNNNHHHGSISAKPQTYRISTSGVRGSRNNYNNLPRVTTPDRLTLSSALLESIEQSSNNQN